MQTTSKILLTLWVSAVATFAFTAAYIIPKDDSINAPGELGEVFSATGITIFVALIAISIIIALIANWKR